MSGIRTVYADVRVDIRVVHIIFVNTGFAIVALTKILDFVAFQEFFTNPAGIVVRRTFPFVTTAVVAKNDTFTLLAVCVAVRAFVRCRHSDALKFPCFRIPNNVRIF